MAMSLLETYEQQYGNLTSEITHKLGKLQKSQSNDASSQDRHVLDNLFSETRELLEQMRLEISELQGPAKEKYVNRLKSYEKELEKLHLEFKKPRHNHDEIHTREELFGSTSYNYGYDDQRVQLLDNTARLERSGNKLDESYRIAVESESIAATVLQDLHHQRETLERSRERLKEVNDDIGRSSRILSSMLRKVIQNRVVLFLVILFIVLLVSITLVYVIRKHSS